MKYIQQLFEGLMNNPTIEPIYALKFIIFFVIIMAIGFGLFFGVKGLHYLLHLFPDRPATKYNYKDSELYHPTEIKWTKHY